MNLERLLSKPFLQLEHRLTARDCMLYALGIGVGTNPVDPSELEFVYEAGLKVFPAMVNVVSYHDGWLRDPALEIDWVKVLHGEQTFELRRPLEVGETYVGSYRVTGVLDKGPDKGAFVYIEKTLRERGRDELVGVVTSTLALRGDGGCGGTLTETPPPQTVPDRPADARCTLGTLPQAALIYRLSRDFNPIHADPKTARAAGFEKPILHGLCSLGVATRAVIKTCCAERPERLVSLKLRFSGPVYPGETIVTEIWRDDSRIGFRSFAAERRVQVLSNGAAEIALA
jgi:acyl dehydratase